jgi:hypothetical protein
MASCYSILVCERFIENLSCRSNLHTLNFFGTGQVLLSTTHVSSTKVIECRADASVATLRMHVSRHPAVKSRSLVLHDRPYRLLYRGYRSDCKLLVQTMRRYIDMDTPMTTQKFPQPNHCS